MVIGAALMLVGEAYARFCAQMIQAQMRRLGVGNARPL
jgi:hypothetical protein